ncbi:MAG: adenylate/guanylate cyclase domain-containing protein, partial [Cyanobacteriota bacterium]
SQAIHRLSFAMDSFGRYLPREVVRSVLASNRSARLGGDVRDLVIMFTDIKDFTSYSESMEASTLLSHLNQYLTALTNSILESTGTIDKYIGDSIMAFWGAPTPLQAPATLACTAALAIRSETERINRQWQEEGLVLRFETRIGINIGPVIVGNVGSEERFNYTVVGDSVNLASRLESTNKLYGTDILVSRSIVLAVETENPDIPYVFRLLDRVKVKGKAQSSEIYALLGRSDQFSPEQISDLQSANEIMAQALDFGPEEGLRLLCCLPETERQTPALLGLQDLLQKRLND